MPTTQLVWADPPARADRAARGNVARMVQELKKHPGKWALVSPGQKTPTQAYKRGVQYSGTEWRSVRRDDGQFDLYGRWVGEGSS